MKGGGHFRPAREENAVKLLRAWMLPLLLFAMLGCGKTHDQPSSVSKQDAVVTAVENLQGSVEYDEESSDMHGNVH